MDKIIKVAIIGVGSRGGEAYGKNMFPLKDKYLITSLCDISREVLSYYGNKFNVSKDNLFDNEEEFFKCKRGDLLVISTLDKDHVREALKGIKLGYDILLEKPISKDEKELKALLDASKKYQKKVVVCHVLRYAPAFKKIKEILDKGEIGKLIHISAYERVAYWHQLHSFVRGRWKNEKETSPMILAKCCHDLDLLTYYADSKAKTVSSIGELSFFNKNNAPKEAKKYCYSCPLLDTCIYSAKRIYLTDKSAPGKTMHINGWPQNTIVKMPVTKEKLENALRKGPYGRCAFFSHNDVVDNQITNIVFENGVKASLIMSAFNIGGRRYTLSGTKGEIVLDELSDEFIVYIFGDKTYKTKISKLVSSTRGHGGGDIGLINDLYLVLTNQINASSNLEVSLESHYIALASEISRKNHGKVIKLNK